MNINGICFYTQSKPIIMKNHNNIGVTEVKSEVVSFKGDIKSELTQKKQIPYRLKSKFQNDFHITGKQIFIRKYIELKNQGLTNEEIAKKLYSSTEDYMYTEEEKIEQLKTVNQVEQLIKDIDNSFKKVIPTLTPRTYYRGVVGDEKSNRAIQIINSAKVGDIIEPDLGYSFLASNISYAKDYSKYLDDVSNPETCALMVIKTPAGTPISRDIGFGFLTPDTNVVLARGAKYKVLNKEIKDDRTFITLEYLSCAMDENEI